MKPSSNAYTSTRLRQLDDRLPAHLRAKSVTHSNETRWILSNGSRALAFSTKSGRSYTGMWFDHAKPKSDNRSTWAGTKEEMIDKHEEAAREASAQGALAAHGEGAASHDDVAQLCQRGGQVEVELLGPTWYGEPRSVTGQPELDRGPGGDGGSGHRERLVAALGILRATSDLDGK